ncbi:MAG: YfhO family protein [Saccharofermentans sp.]|nr:YfhO family protein [Saccharofermentans sp.]
MLKSKLNNKNTVLLYSGLFVIFMLLCILLFYGILGKDLFPNYDGITQQYTYFVYCGTWIKHLFSNIFVKHVFELPNWDMSVFGFDPFMMISEIQLFNPLYWLSAIFPKPVLEYVFNAVIVIQYYLSGLSFLYFCSYRKHNGIGAVFGALSYVFSGFAFIGLIQANFTVLFILFPLLIVGADKLWDEGKFIHYCLIVAYCTIYSYYFLYIMGMMLVFYCIIKFATEEERNIKKLISLILRFTLFTLIGIGIGIGPSIPGIINLAGIDRLDLERPFRFTYGLVRVKKIFGGMFSYVDLENEYESNYGMTALIIPCFYILWKNRSKYKRTIILAACFFISLFIPFIGSLMNGFDYSSQRYIFGFILILAYIITIGIENIDQISTKEYGFMLIFTAVYSLLCLFTNELYGIMSAVSAVITIALLWIFSSKGIKRKRFLLIPLLISCFIIGFTQSIIIPTARGINLGDAFASVYNKEGIDLIRSYDDTDALRYDRLNNYYGSFTSNASMTAGLNGYDFYHSNYNNYLSNYIDDMGLVSDGVCFCYRNLHGRTFLEIMNGTKYITAPDDLTYYVPYSYALYETSATQQEYSSYISMNDVSMVYFYDETFSESSYSELNPALKEELLMNYMVTDSSTNTSVNDGYFKVQSIPYTIDVLNGMEINGNRISVTDPGAFMLISMDEQSDDELMLWVNNLQMDVSNDLITPMFQVTPTLISDRQEVASDAFVSNTANRSVYHIRKDWLFTFNMAGRSCNQILIYFDTLGEYQFDGLEILSRSIEDTQSFIDTFEAHADIDNVSYSIDGTHIYADISSASDRYLYFAIPYSQGWTAEIDGEPAEIIRANRAFMAIRTEAGDHHIELTYKTPYLLAGIMVSAVSALCLGVCIFIKGTNNGSKRKTK